MYCITGTWKGLVDMPYCFRISPQESWGTYFVCTSYGVQLNFFIASRFTQPCQQTLRAIYSYIPEIQKQYGTSTRPFRVSVMQYIRCCGRGVVSRLAIGNWPDLEIIWISMNHAFCNVQECDYHDHDTISNVFLWTTLHWLLHTCR